MLVLEQVSYRYAGAKRPSLEAIDLTIREGRVLGVVGSNEAGKTTLCLVVAGLAPRIIGGELTGRLTIDGADSRALPMHEVAGRVGIVFDDPTTQMSGVASTVYEEIAFGPANLGLARGELIERTEAAIATLAIGHLADRDPWRLSGGQQQLVAIASILAMRPAHLVLDEPTAQLDPAGTALVADALVRLRASGVAVLVVEHKTNVLAALADEVVALDEGRVIMSGSAEILGDPRLGELGVIEPDAARILRQIRERGGDPAPVERLLAR